MIIQLRGWSIDRDISVLSLMLQEAAEQPCTGIFKGSAFITDIDVSAAVQKLISDYFKPLNLVETKMIKKKSINADAQNIIFTKYPLWVQSNCANGVYPVLFVSQMKTDISAVIAASNIATDAITAAIDESSVDAVNPIWPVI